MSARRTAFLTDSIQERLRPVLPDECRVGAEHGDTTGTVERDGDSDPEWISRDEIGTVSVEPLRYQLVVR